MKKNLLFSVFAVVLAGIAAMAATTAYLNAPERPQQRDTAAAIRATMERMAIEKRAAEAAHALQGAGTATPDATPAPAKDAPAQKPAAAGPANASAPANATDTAEEEADKDPYEGLDPEELPPDLQYNADSSVSFPTNI